MNSLEEVSTPQAVASRVSSAATTTRGSTSSAKATLLKAASEGTSSLTAKAGASTAKAPAAGQGTLNVNSIPVSNVIVNGRPMGSTPKMGLSVAAGTHTIVFVHPEHGRKVVTVTVAAGATQTAATRFP